MIKRDIFRKYNREKFFSIMIFILEGNLIYGYRKGEWLIYCLLDLFLRMIYLEVNDVFVIVLLVVNMSCFMGLFLMSGGILKRLIYFVWFLVFYNISLIILCFLVFVLF